jgi:putative ABC transport system permease protein
MYADSSVFNVFTFPLVNGNPKTALKEPFTIVLSESTAAKIFGKTNPVGKFVRYNNEFSLLITGIVKDPPENSQIKFNALISFATLYEMPNMYLGVDGGHRYYTYVKLHKETSIERMSERLPAFMEEKINYKYREYGLVLSLIFEPLEKIHLYSEVSGPLKTRGDLEKIYTLSSIALFILLIACINFINLSTARSIKRAKEVGVRKVVGATKSKLILQFLGESFILSFISLLLALIIIEIFQPVFNSLVYSNLSLYHQSNVKIFLGLIIIAGLTGLAAGSFPAFYISGFKPVSILKGGFHSYKGKPQLRKVLVFIQFFITAVLIVSTITFFLQLSFLKNKDLGFDKENVVLVELTSETAMRKADVLKNELRNLPDVQHVAASTNCPGSGLTMNGYLPEGLKNPIMIHVMDVDYDYLDLMGLKIVKGRNFSKDFGTDQTAFIINEILAKHLNWENPIGKYIHRSGKHKVIGVVKDFHFAPLHLEIKPLLITVNPWDYYYLLSVKIMPGNDMETINSIESVWKKLFPDEPFEYAFLDKSIEKNYSGVFHRGKTFIYFSIIAILLAGLGLFGQAVFNIEQRTKEIGIRKVFGAEVHKILRILTVDVIKIVLIANVLALPVAWYINNNWLQLFAYHIGFPWYTFLFTIIFSLALAILTVSYQAYKAAVKNPVEALRFE